MSLSLETMRRMMRDSRALPDNMSETEIRHYSTEVLKRLKLGHDVGALDTYLRGIDTSIARCTNGATTHDLAIRAHILFNTTADGPLRE
jgi:hypothetical protein